MTQTLIEAAVTLADIAKVTKSTVTKVEAGARELALFIGADWAGRPALDVRDAASLVSGAARRDHDHADAHRRWRAGSEDWELQREAVRRTAYNNRFDAARRRGVGDPAAAHEAAKVASAAVESFEKSTPQPTFGDGAPSRLSMRSRARKVVVR